jgi:hemerythrin superfamily protein
MTDTAPNAQQDAIRFIAQQHEQVRTLLQTIASASGEAQRQPFETLVRLLAVHETAEEMVIYPTLREAGEEGDRVADARLKEEDEAKKVLSELEKLDPATAEFEAMFTAFRSSVESHAESEEREVFPLLERITDKERLRRMAAALEFAESVAPTHPHKLAPESAVGNMLVGPFVAVVDRLRDALRDVTR